MDACRAAATKDARALGSGSTPSLQGSWHSACPLPTAPPSQWRPATQRYAPPRDAIELDLASLSAVQTELPQPLPGSAPCFSVPALPRRINATRPMRAPIPASSASGSVVLMQCFLRARKRCTSTSLGAFNHASAHVGGGAGAARVGVAEYALRARVCRATNRDISGRQIGFPSHYVLLAAGGVRPRSGSGLLSPDVLRLCTLSAPRKHVREGDCAPCAAAPVAPGRHVVPRLQLQATSGNLDRLRRRRGPPSQEPVAGKDTAWVPGQARVAVCLSVVQPSERGLGSVSGKPFALRGSNAGPVGAGSVWPLFVVPWRGESVVLCCELRDGQGPGCGEDWMRLGCFILAGLRAG
ncbi:hypothetical protein VTO73DRAFT_5601 [Trametes versicolor]